jgi:hypothetical protein
MFRGHILPMTTLVPALTLYLTTLITSPFIPWIGAVVAMLLLAFRLRLLRF